MPEEILQFYGTRRKNPKCAAEAEADNGRHNCCRRTRMPGGEGWSCTRPEGHEGVHIASGEREDLITRERYEAILERWYLDEP
jgi:hypothetical protein